jgi:tetratricopeptide (TPR) repeat protein
MGVCYFNLQDFANAIKEMETALKYVPNHQIAHLNLGVVNLSAGNIENQKSGLQKAYDLNPTNEVGKKAEQLLKNH